MGLNSKLKKYLHSYIISKVYLIEYIEWIQQNIDK